MMTGKHITGVLMMAVALSTTCANATIIEVNGISVGNNDAVPLTFGSNLSSDTGGATVSNGATPDIALIWAGPGGGWDAHGGNNGLWAALDPAGPTSSTPTIAQMEYPTAATPMTVTFTVATGKRLVLNSVDIGMATDKIDTYYFDVTISEVGGAEVFSTLTAAMDGDGGSGVQALTVTFNFTGTLGTDYVLALNDVDSLGDDTITNNGGGIDNLSFNQAAIPTSENFDGLVNGSDFIPAQNNWGADVASIVVTTDEAQSGANSVDINSGTISNNVDEASPSGVVWTEFYLIPNLGDEPSSVSAAGNHVHYYDTNATLNVYVSAAFVQITEDIHGNALSAVSTTSFNRISIYQNFNTSTSAVLLNGAVILQDVLFPGTSTSYDSFEVQNTKAPSAYLDTYSVGTTVPSSSDGNGNGTDDAQELNDNGYVARNLTVGETAAEDYASLSAAGAVARDGDKIIVTNVTGTLDGGGAATFNASITITGEDFTTDFAVTVGAGETLTIDGVAMDVDGTATVNGTLLVASSGSFTSTDTTMGGSGAIDSNGGTWGTDSPVVQLSGTFDISGAAYNNAAYESSLNFADDFEQYSVGTVLSGLNFRGWGASSASSVIQSSKVQEGSRAATVSGLVSNRVDGGAVNKVWTDFQLCAAHGAEPSSPDTGSASALFYMTTNGYLAVWTGAAFVEQTTDAGGGAVAAVDTNTWTRVTVFTQYDTDEAAIFLDDQLLIEQVSFPSGGATAYSLFAVESADSDANLDDVDITALTPSGMSGDVDGDTRPDVGEIQQFGTITAQGHPAAVIRFL